MRNHWRDCSVRRIGIAAGKAVLAVAEYGRGQVTVFADGWLFSTESMGISRETPTESQRRNHELAYLVLDETLRLRRRVREGS
jgi:hypothetical protein